MVPREIKFYDSKFYREIEDTFNKIKDLIKRKPDSWEADMQITKLKGMERMITLLESIDRRIERIEKAKENPENRYIG